MFRLILGAYLLGAFFEFCSTFIILVFFAFRPGVGIIPGIKEAFAALAVFAVFAFLAAVIWPGIGPTLVALIYYDLQAQKAQEGKEDAQEGRQTDGN